MPAGWEALLQLGSIGPLARSIDDLRLAYSAISGMNVVAPPVPADLRIAWSTEFEGAPLSDESKQLMWQFVRGLAQAGYRIEEQSPADLDYRSAWYPSGVCLGTINTLFQAWLTRWLRWMGRPVLARFGSQDALMQGLFAGVSLRPQVVSEALRQREVLIEQLEHFLHQYDVWICPVFPVPAFTHRARNAPIRADEQQVSQLAANLLHSIIFNVSGHPVVTIPIGHTADGLPVGVQLIGRRSEEVALLAVAERIAAGCTGYQPPPGYT